MQAKAARKTATDAAHKSGKLIGYARVSTTDQDLKVQREALRRAGVGVVFEERASGTKRDGRTELQKVLSILGKGDALVVTRLDRLGRSLRDLANIAHEIEQAGAHLKVLEQSVDTSSAAGRAFFGMLATFAAFETDVRRERQLEGIARAKAEGRTGGRPSLVTTDLRTAIRGHRAAGDSIRAIAAKVGLSKATIQKVLAALPPAGA